MDRFLLTPFVIDQGSPGHLRLRTPGAWVNQPTFFDARPTSRIQAVHAPLAQAVQNSLQAGQRPVSVAGDCCAVLPVIAGLQRAGVAPRLLWLDAHGDFNTAETSPSGFIGGMPLAMLVGRGDQSLMSHLRAVPIPEDDVVLFNARDLDPLEQDALAASGVKHLKTLEALASEPLGDRPLHIHLDADVINPLDCPDVHYPASGGPRLAELEAAVRRLVSNARPVSVSLTTWIVDQDANGRSQQAAMRLLDAIRT
jgi:arginase